MRTILLLLLLLPTAARATGPLCAKMAEFMVTTVQARDRGIPRAKIHTIIREQCPKAPELCKATASMVDVVYDTPSIGVKTAQAIVLDNCDVLE